MAKECALLTESVCTVLLQLTSLISPASLLNSYSANDPHGKSLPVPSSNNRSSHAGAATSLPAALAGAGVRVQLDVGLTPQPSTAPADSSQDFFNDTAAEEELQHADGAQEHMTDEFGAVAEAASGEYEQHGDDEQFEDGAEFEAQLIDDDEDGADAHDDSDGSGLFLRRARHSGGSALEYSADLADAGADSDPDAELDGMDPAEMDEDQQLRYLARQARLHEAQMAESQHQSSVTPPQRTPQHALVSTVTPPTRSTRPGAYASGSAAPPRAPSTHRTHSRVYHYTLSDDEEEQGSVDPASSVTREFTAARRRLNLESDEDMSMEATSPRALSAAAAAAAAMAADFTPPSRLSSGRESDVGVALDGQLQMDIQAQVAAAGLDLNELGLSPEELESLLAEQHMVMAQARAEHA